jgi:phosphate transport system substrate-binding protein
MKTQIIATLITCGLLAFSSIAQAQVSGAGATFPELLYNNWAKEYKASGGPAINYQGIGSGGGIKAITARTVDFGASDSPMSAEERKLAPGILHIPTCAGAVAVAYNAPGLPVGLKLTGQVIADIFAHKITKWDDASIARLNPTIKMPSTRIVVVTRSDSSGTTAIFTNYLAKVSPSFKASIGEGKSPKWPNGGIAGKGTAGVAAFIKQTPGAIGYVELAFAEKNNITYASVQNAKKKFIEPTLQSTSLAASGVSLPSDFCAMATSTQNPQGYPIVGFTWILIYPNANPEVKQFLRWCLTNGQKSAAKYDYAALPPQVQQRVLKSLGK